MKLIKTEKERTLPYPGRITVKIGQKVKSNDDVAVLDYVPGKVYKIPVTKHLSLPNEKLEQVTVVKPGDHVTKGQVLAINNVLYQPFVSSAPIEGVVGIISKHLGQIYLRDYIPLDNNAADDVVFDLNEIFPDVKPKIMAQRILVRPGNRISPSQILAQVSMKRYVASNVYGQVMSIDNNRIVISSIKINSKLKAYLPGTVTEIKGRDSVTVTGEAYQLQGVYGLGGERQGYLRVIGNCNTVLQPQDITESDCDTIIFAPGGITLKALNRANELGVQAVITTYMPFLEVKNYAGVDFVPGITGGENITTGLLLLKGFVAQQLEQDIYDFVCNYDGLWVSMTGTTHIRAGALRPELILPLVAGLDYKQDQFNDVIDVNSWVEVKRSGDLHGYQGVVKELLAQPVMLPALVKVLVAVVEIEGKEYQVPLTNLVPVRRKQNE